MRGALRITAEGYYADDNGLVLPLFVHVGNAFALWCQGKRDFIRGLAKASKGAGYHGWRSWTILDSGDHWYWHGYTTGPHVTPNYWGELRDFGQMLADEGLKWVVSNGDILRVLTSTSTRVEFMQRLTQTLDREWVAEVDCGNEIPNNGLANPNDASECVPMARAVAAVWPDVPLVLSSSQSEETAQINDLSVRPCTIYSVHSSRGGDYVMKLRHPFSTGYEAGIHRSTGHNSEPPGVCDWSRQPPLVSATSQPEELDAELMAFMAAHSYPSGMAWTLFSGAGVKCDLEDLLSAVGFAETPRAVALLPNDIMTWWRCHGGTSQHARIYAVPVFDPNGTDPDTEAKRQTRADHAIAPDGRFCVRLYGPRWHQCFSVRAHTVDSQVDFGNWGRLILGRLA